MAPIPKTIGDFSVLPVQMPIPPSLESTLSSPPTHFIYIRRNAPKIPTADDSRSLFLANVPVDSTAAHFRALFAALVGPGRFESIVFEDERRRQRGRGIGIGDSEAQLASSRKRKREDGSHKGSRADGDDDKEAAEAAKQRKEEQASRLPETWSPRLHHSGGTAVALLVDAKSVQLVLRAAAQLRKGPMPQWPQADASTSLAPLGAPWLAAHSRRLTYPDRAVVSRAVDAYFVAFNRREAAAAALARRMRNEPDADGFVTVSAGGGGSKGNGGRNAPARRAEAEAARAKQLAKQARQQAEMTSFYQFQLRERKKAEQAEMVRQFQDDRERVAAMQAKRGKFRPEA